MYKLVIVDDDSLMLRHFVAGYNWEEMGFSVVNSFHCAEDCIEYLSEHPVHALITDIRLPNMSGLELVKYCSESLPDIAIILLSAYANFEYAHQAIKYNIIDYVLKPIDYDDLVNAMSKMKQYLDKLVPNVDVPVIDSTPMKQIKQFIADHLQENITVNDVASHAMISPQYFSFYFKKNTGETFSTYLQKARLEKACELLKNTDIKIAAIAEMVSYKTSTSFFKYFYEQYHMTPAEYRKLHKKS